LSRFWPLLALRHPWRLNRRLPESAPFSGPAAATIDLGNVCADPGSCLVLLGTVLDGTVGRRCQMPRWSSRVSAFSP